jgi:hypothetical protein
LALFFVEGRVSSEILPFAHCRFFVYNVDVTDVHVKIRAKIKIVDITEPRVAANQTYRIAQCTSWRWPIGKNSAVAASITGTNRP